jgi:hypothetical protein
MSHDADRSRGRGFSRNLLQRTREPSDETSSAVSDERSSER